MGIWLFGYRDLDMDICRFRSYAEIGLFGARRGQGGLFSITMAFHRGALLPKQHFPNQSLLITIIISNIYLWKTMWISLWITLNNPVDNPYYLTKYQVNLGYPNSFVCG
jgi:hypothetical protein